jgi:hypothetical protein
MNRSRRKASLAGVCVVSENAGSRLTFEDEDAGAGPARVDGGGHPGVAATDDEDVVDASEVHVGRVMPPVGDEPDSAYGTAREQMSTFACSVIKYHCAGTLTARTVGPGSRRRMRESTRGVADPSSAS